MWRNTKNRVRKSPDNCKSTISKIQSSNVAWFCNIFRYFKLSRIHGVLEARQTVIKMKTLLHSVLRYLDTVCDGSWVVRKCYRVQFSDPIHLHKLDNLKSLKMLQNQATSELWIFEFVDFPLSGELLTAFFEFLGVEKTLV